MPPKRDLIILAADKNMEFALKGILSRPKALGIRSIDYEIRTHPGHDGGARTNGHQILRLFRNQFAHALLIFDREGSGAEGAQSAEAIEADVEIRLKVTWGDDARAIVIQPELEVWTWGSDTVLRDALGWDPDRGLLRDWLKASAHTFDDNGKPGRPKEALEAVLRELRFPRSSSIYQDITSKISLAKCTDAAFQRLRSALLEWFPGDGAGR